jgi:hypothetical protein
MDLDLDDDYKVEHDDNFVLTVDQVRKLIDAKFERNGRLAELIQMREDLLKD